MHAPSGKPSLTDAQRTTLLRNLLQSNSESSPGHTIGTARFVICGDMNTAPHSLSQMLQMLRQQGVLHTTAHVMAGTMPKHGDVCFVGGLLAQSLETTSKNHDPQHDPYGIHWISPQIGPPLWAQYSISNFGSHRSRPELQNTNLPEHEYVTEQPPMTFRGSAAAQTQPEEAKKPLPAKELQQTALADAGFEKDDARMPASGSATEQTLPEEKSQPLRHGAELHSTCASGLQKIIDKLIAQRPRCELTNPASSSPTTQTQPEDTKKQLPAKELQQTALADAGFEKDDARMPASGSATKQTLPEDKSQPLRHGAELHTCASGLQTQWISSQAAPAWARCPSSSFGSPRCRLELQNTNLPEHEYVTEQPPPPPSPSITRSELEDWRYKEEVRIAMEVSRNSSRDPMTCRGSATAQTQPEEMKKPLPAKELQQAALADAGFQKDDARMPASGSATEQTLPEEKSQPLRHGAELHSTCYNGLQKIIDKLIAQRPRCELMKDRKSVV